MVLADYVRVPRQGPSHATFVSTYFKAHEQHPDAIALGPQTGLRIACTTSQ